MNEDRYIHPDRIAFANRGNRFRWDAYQSDGITPMQLGATDVPRFKLARTEDGVPIIDIKLGTPSTGGSTITIDASLTFGYVFLSPTDVAGLSGFYYDEVDYVDHADSLIKPIVRGKINFRKSQSGNTGA
jgi:hypothetical protein